MAKEKAGVTFKIANAEKLAADIAKFGKQGEKVIKYTVSDTKKRAVPIVKDNILAKYGLQKRDLNDKTAATINTREQGKAGSVNVGIIIRGRRLTARRFGMTPKRPAGFKKLGKKEMFVSKLRNGEYKTFSKQRKPYSISVEIEKGQRKTYQPKGDTRYFLNNIRGGDIIVPWQVEGKKQPRPIMTLSVPQMIGNNTVKENTLNEIDGLYRKRFKHHYDRLIKNKD